jgi:hypothetical protein
MADLEEVERSKAPGDQPRLDRRFGVAREEEAPPLEGAEQDDRRVVHDAAVIRRGVRHVASVRPQDLDIDAVKHEVIAGGQPRGLQAATCKSAGERLVARPLPGHSRLGDPADAVPLEDGG